MDLSVRVSQHHVLYASLRALCLTAVSTDRQRLHIPHMLLVRGPVREHGQRRNVHRADLVHLVHTRIHHHRVVIVDVDRIDARHQILEHLHRVNQTMRLRRGLRVHLRRRGVQRADTRRITVHEAMIIKNHPMHMVSPRIRSTLPPNKS